jgi:leader peptidase (prepilin peptidase)/N-methyltransferase|tara:strand:- start:645 stop:1406 length:762 start_codon:yes stop_codon:yes gene_type:complete
VDFIFIIIIGALWGSFANVCIYRLPLDKGVVSGRSFCPKCKKKITWVDNIPIISFLLIQGKCRKCKKKISFQYPLVETISAFTFFIIYYLYGITTTTLLLIVLGLSFIIIFFIDLKHYIIPDSLTFPMMILGFIKSFDPNLNSLFPDYINSLIGGLFGYGSIWSIIYFYKVVRKKEGMGLGDAKLLAVIGFWFGWISIPFVIFISSVVALITVTPSLMNKSKKLTSEIPFGPFIIIGCIMYVIFVEQFKIMFF